MDIRTTIQNKGDYYLPIKYIVECIENRVDPDNRTKIIQSVPLVSSIFNTQNQVTKFIETWNHMFNERQGRCVEFRTFNNRTHPNKFSRA